VKYSVIIPCRNGESVLGRQLEALAAQDFAGDWEIVVADNGSQDSSAEVVRHHMERMPNLRLIDASGTPGINHARNRGVQESTGDFLLFCDCDDEAAPDWLRQMDQAVENGAVMVGGQLIEADSANEFGATDVYPLYGDFGYLLWPAGANCGFARDVYTAVGPFDEGFLGGCDETDFFWRGQLAGMYLTGVRQATVVYTLRQGTKATWKQFVNYGRMHVKLYRKYADQAMPRAHGVLSTVRLVRRIADAGTHPRDADRRLALVKRAGEIAGRLQGSVREKVFYV
jgi:glycosyltransferase involved in cell wall biosynthesis